MRRKIYTGRSNVFMQMRRRERSGVGHWRMRNRYQYNEGLLYITSVARAERAWYSSARVIIMEVQCPCSRAEQVYWLLGRIQTRVVIEWWELFARPVVGGSTSLMLPLDCRCCVMAGWSLVIDRVTPFCDNDTARGAARSDNWHQVYRGSPRAATVAIAITSALRDTGRRG